MENIRQAIERAKGGKRSEATLEASRQQAGKVLGDAYSKERIQEFEPNPLHLQSQRIVAFDGKDIHSRSFDMLRTEVLQSMDQSHWRVLAVTSPTPSCGKTVTAVNLALSMARQPDRQIFLVDLDLRKPNVATSLGLQCKGGVEAVIEGRLGLDEAIIQVRVGGSRLGVLPSVPASNAADLVGSASMKMLLQDIGRYVNSRIVIIDLPPMLTGHDVISVLPHVDCVLLVAAIGTTKVSEITECNKYLQETNVVRFVLNKAPESATSLAYY
jgi:protein-tyrosine kinase